MNSLIKPPPRAAAHALVDLEAVQVLESLVRIPSVSGTEGRAVEEFVKNARRLRFDAHIDEAGNGVATCGASEPSAREIVLLGHIDTVPGDLPVHVTDGVLHGRGSVDAKGPLATMLVAAARAAIAPAVRLRVIAAVGEETPDSPGAHHVARSLRPAACVIGEPGGASGVGLGYKGRLLVRAIFEAQVSHSAGPAGSAGDAAIAWWAGVRRSVAAPAPAARGVFDASQASIRGMASSNDGIQDRAIIDAGFRLPLSIAPETLERELRRLAPPGCTLAFAGHTPAFRAGRDNHVAAALSSAIRCAGMVPRPLLKTGTADMNIVGPVWDCPIAAYGPGDSALDHTPEERLDLNEYVRSIRVLAAALSDLSDRVRN